MIQYYVLDDSGEAVEATEDASHRWLLTEFYTYMVYQSANSGCGTSVVTFHRVSNSETGDLPFKVEFRIHPSDRYGQAASNGPFAYFRHRADAIAHAQKITEKVGAAWNGILDIIQQELPSKA